MQNKIEALAVEELCDGEWVDFNSEEVGREGWEREDQGAEFRSALQELSTIIVTPEGKRALGEFCKLYRSGKWEAVHEQATANAAKTEPAAEKKPDDQDTKKPSWIYA